MNSQVNANVVHESEAQRQHARVKIPAKLRFFNSDRTPTEAKVIDLSAGGLAFTATQPLTIGQVHKGRLQFVIDNLGLAMDVELQIRSYDRQTGRTGCQFQNLDAQDISTLRHLITSHLSGDIVTMGDVLATLQRDNFTKARKVKDGGSGMTAFGRLRAVTFSLAIFLVGLAAFGFVVKSLYGMYFVSHAQAGLVSVPGMNVTMPRDGTVQSLLKGDAVAAIREEMVARALVFDFQRAISRWNQVPGDAIMHLARSAHCFRHFVGVEAERLNFCHQSRLVFENQYWLVRLSDDNSPGLKK